MTVFTELDADPPRLRRSDGLVVQFRAGAGGTFPLIEAGWMQGDDEFELLLRWRGFRYQELQPGRADDRNVAQDVFLIGHASRSGYSSAVVGLSDSGVAMEFADIVAPGADGVDRVVADMEVSTRRRFKRLTDAEFRVFERRRLGGGLAYERFELSRPHDKGAIRHTHWLVVRKRKEK